MQAPQTSLRLLRAVAFIAFVAILLPLTPARAADNPLVGKWSGTFQCGGSVPFSMSLSAGGAGLVSGEFHFKRDGKSGAYHVRGRATGKQFMVAPLDWIDRPAGISAVGLAGEIHANGLSMHGKLDGCRAFGDQVFTATRDDSDQAGATNAFAEPPLTPPEAGPMQGNWKGSVNCPRLKPAVLPVRLTVYQEEHAVAALLSVGFPAGNGHLKDRQAVMRGTTDSAGNVSLALWVPVSPQQRWVQGVKLQLNGGGNSLGIEINRLPGNWHCGALTMKRSGSLDVPKVADAERLTGDWTGYAVRSATGALFSDDFARKFLGYRAVRFELKQSADGLFGRYELTAPITVPLAQQDRYRVTVRPLFKLSDGRLVLVPIKVLRAEGQFAPSKFTHTPGQWQSANIRYLLAVSRGTDGVLVLDRLVNVKAPTQGVMRARLHAVTANEKAALDAGQAPRVIFPAPIGGTLAAATSLDAQCRVVTDWTQPVRTSGDPDRNTVEGLLKLAAPMFSDGTFRAVYGVPFSLTTQPERRTLYAFMMDICARRSQDRVLSHVSGPLLTEQGFNSMLALLMNSRESSSWLDKTLAQIGDLPDDAASRDKLGEIEKEAGRRNDEFNNDGRTRLAGAVKAKRDAIATALLMERAKAVAGLPEQRETLPLLKTLLADADHAPLSQADRASVQSAALTKANTIVAGLIKTSVEKAEDAPDTLAGLATVTSSARALVQIASMLGPTLSTIDVVAVTAPIRRKRQQMLGDPAIRSAFVQMMGAIESGGDAIIATKNAASRYLYSREFGERSGIPFYARTVHDTAQRLELASISFADRSTPAVAGEPSAKEMLLAVKATFDQINENLSDTFDRCQARQFQGDPIMAAKCLTILAGGDGDRLRMRLTRFEKLGCANATVESGYICDYVIGFSSNSPYMQGEMGRTFGTGSNAQGRFLHANDGWIFVRQ